jgi:hypothetical protein
MFVPLSSGSYAESAHRALNFAAVHSRPFRPPSIAGMVDNTLNNTLWRLPRINKFVCKGGENIEHRVFLISCVGTNLKVNFYSICRARA